jgi:SAM-dependent methyltransferase
MIGQLLNRYLKGFEAKRILDVGPGYNNFGCISARITGATHITYVDNDSDVLNWQYHACQKASILCNCLLLSLDEVCDLGKLGYLYDIILCQEILEHLQEPEYLLANLARLLSYSGRIVITVPTKTSERWLRFLNPSYMSDEQGGHIQEFDKQRMMELLQESGLVPLIFITTQPHYFIAHSWLFGSRMKVDVSTGEIKTKGIRHFVLGLLTTGSKRFFELTGFETWGRLLPRNYFIIATRSSNKASN